MGAADEHLSELEAAIAGLEAHRAALGDAVVEAALVPLRVKLAALRNPESPQPSLAGERRLITVMFADISGFTPLAEKQDPEVVRDLMNACFERLAPVIEKYGGTIDKFMGDGIMALFGAPLAHENDAERALCAALEMLSALEAFGVEHGTALGMHLGINTGLVLAGGIGSSEQQSYSVMGDTVNVAARLEGAAERGQVWVGADTYRLTAPLFAFAPLPPVSVKGRDEAVAAYRLIGAQAGAGSVRGLGRQGLSSPLVGREPELGVLQGCLERLRAGQGGIVSLTGDAGLGKSRLVAEVRRPYETGPAPLVWLEGRTLSFGQTISYRPFQEILRRYADMDEDDAEAEAWGKLEQRLAALFPDTLAEILPYLGSLLSLSVPEAYQSRVKYLDGEALGKQIFMASRRFFAQLAALQPLVLVFEDLHWMDESSFALLEHLLPLVQSAPLLVIAVSRPDPDTPGARLRDVALRDYAANSTDLRLAPLSPSDGALLVRNLLDIEDLSARTRDLIVSKAEGNPFYIEEVIRTLIETGAVVRGAGSTRWRATALSESLPIPDTIQGVIMARVDRLDEGVKQVLRLASVIGRSFLYRVLRALDEANGELDQHLESLQAVELIREKQAAPELEYMFRHALAQEATYASILLQKRRDWHARVGRVIETLFADRLEEFYSLLAYHYAQAEAWEPAQAYLFKAGDQAGRMAADAEALTHYQQAMAAYAKAFGDKWDALERAQFERKIGESFYRRGEHSQACVHLLRASGLLGSSFPATRQGVRLATAREGLVQIAHRLFPTLLVKRQQGEVAPRTRETMRIAAILGWIFAASDDELVTLMGLRQLNSYESQGCPEGIAESAAGIGWACDMMGLRWLSGVYHGWAATNAGQSQQSSFAFVHFCLAVHEHCGGDWGAAIKHYEQAIRVHRKIGNMTGWGYDLALARLWCLTVDCVSVAPMLRDAIQVFRDAGDKHALAVALQNLAHVLVRSGELQEALRTSQESVALHREMSTYNSLVEASGELGYTLLRLGQWDQARSLLEQSEQLIKQHGIKGILITQPRNGLAETYMVAAEQASALEKGTWLRRAQGACQAALKQGQVDRSGWLRAVRLQARYEWLSGRPKSAQHWWQRGMAEAQRLGASYEAGMLQLEMGERLKDDSLLQQAEVALARMGATLDCARVRRLLGKD